MDHPFPNSQGDIDACGLRFFGKARRIVEHGFIRANADEEGRESAKIAVERRDPWQARVILADVVFTANSGHARRVNTGLQLRSIGVSGQRQIRPRRESHCGGWHGNALILEGQQGSQAQASAGGIPSKHDVG